MSGNLTFNAATSNIQQGNLGQAIQYGINGIFGNMGDPRLAAVGNLFGQIGNQLGNGAKPADLLKSFKDPSNLNLVATAVDQFMPQKREYSGPKGHITKGADAMYNDVANAVGMIPGVGKAAQAAMMGMSAVNKFANKIGAGTDGMTTTDAVLGSSFFTPIGIVNGAFGSKTNSFQANTLADKEDRNYIGSSYANMQFINDAESKSNKKYGLFSQGAKRRANELIRKADGKAAILRGISEEARFRNEFGEAMTSVNTHKYQNSLMGGYDPSTMAFGKEGMKFQEEVKFVPIIADEVEKFQKGGSFNIIPDGALHAHLHKMDDADGLTKKGIPVVDREGKQQAEIERDEIIFRKEVTDKIEKAMEDGSDEAAIEIGKLLVDEIFNNTKDYTGLIKEVTDIEVAKKKNGGTLDLNEKELLLKLLIEKYKND